MRVRAVAHEGLRVRDGLVTGRAHAFHVDGPLRRSALTIGLWLEDGAVDGLRARIESDPQLEVTGSPVYATSPEEILERVRQWLRLAIDHAGKSDAPVTEG